MVCLALQGSQCDLCTLDLPLKLHFTAKPHSTEAEAALTKAQVAVWHCLTVAFGKCNCSNNSQQRWIFHSIAAVGFSEYKNCKHSLPNFLVLTYSAFPLTHQWVLCLFSVKWHPLFGGVRGGREHLPACQWFPPFVDALHQFDHRTEALPGMFQHSHGNT